MAAWDTTYTPGIVGAIDYSNNDKTVELSGSTRTLVVDTKLNPMTVLGTRQYVEIEFDQINPLSVGTSGVKFNTLLQNVTLGDTLQNTTAGGDYTYHDLFAGGSSTQTNAQLMKAGLDRAAFEIPRSNAFIPSADFAPGDRLGIKLEFGSQQSPFEVLVTYYFNGIVLFKWPLTNILDWENAELQVAITISTSSAVGNESIITLVDSAVDWIYEPTDALDANIQEFQNQVIAATVADNGYCRLANVREMAYNSEPNNLAHMPLQNNDLTHRLLQGSTSGIRTNVIATKPRSTGMYYWEVTIANVASQTTSETNIGLFPCCEGGEVSQAVMMAVNFGNGNWQSCRGSSMGGFPGNPGYGTLQSGDVIMFAVDMAHQVNGNELLPEETGLWVGLNGVWENDPTIDIAKTPNSNLKNSYALSAAAWAPGLDLSNSGFGAGGRRMDLTFNFGATAFTYAIPSGFAAWDTTAIPS